MDAISDFFCNTFGLFCEAPRYNKEEQKKAKYPWELDSSISPSDYVRMVSIPDKSSVYITECETRPSIKILETYPSPWTYSKRFMPVLGGTSSKTLSEEESDRRHFWNMLVATIPQLRSSLNLRSATRILDVGCGNGWDAIPLHSYFGGSPYGIPGRNVDYIGIDIDGHQVGMARDYHKNRPDLRFEVADATRLDNYGKFDVIVIRHAEVFTRGSFRYISRTWYKIFKESLAHLAAGGIILITTYRCSEHMGADKAMTSLGAKRLFAALNPFSAKIEIYIGPDLDQRDWYVAVYALDDGSVVIGKQSASTVDSQAVQVSEKKVSARLGDGSAYEVTAGGVERLVYREWVSGRKKKILFDASYMGQVRQLASNGMDTFVFLSGGYLKNLIYRIDWEKGFLEALGVSEFDFTVRAHWRVIFPSVMIKGFHIIDGMLLGEAEIRYDDEDVFMHVYPLGRNSNFRYEVDLRDLSRLEEAFLRFRLLFDW